MRVLGLRPQSWETIERKLNCQWNFVFSNDISCMNVITNTTLQMANIDPKVIQEAQVERDRECLEVNLVRCLQHMSDEGIEVHPTAAIALYLLQLIADFSR